MDKKVSIVIRTKNEERWITQALREVFNQDYGNFEVIIVDNMSQDKTVEKARQFRIAKILACEDYKPGKALNMGIREAEGEYIACLTGHCIPVGNQWLRNFVENFKEGTEVAGVYGRQEPMEFTSDFDKRDLALVFGLDRKIQTKDSFFHDSNGMIRKDVWEKVPFDEDITNIEDRAWAKNVLDRGYKIIYEPRAIVYHYHGIHHNGDVQHCANVVRIIKSLHKDYGRSSIDAEKLDIAAVIPVRGPVQNINGKPLLSYTIERARESKYVKKVIVSTDNEETANTARKFGAETPFMRDRSFSGPQVNMPQVLRHSLEKMEALGILPDLIVSLEITFPFRPKNLIDDMILQLTENGFDSVVAASRENKAIWKEREGRIIQLDEGLVPRALKDPTFVELKGIGCVTHSEFIRDGRLFGEKIGIYELDNPYSHIEVRSEEDFKMASLLVKSWFK